MRKTFEHRHCPTKRQQRLLDQRLEERRWLYHHLPAARREAWEQRQESVRLSAQQATLYAQQATLPALKAERPALAGAQSQVVPHVAVRLDLAVQAFSRRACALFETTLLVLRASLLIFDSDRDANLAGAFHHTAKSLASRLTTCRME